MDLAIPGFAASVEPPDPVVPKNIASAVRVVVRAGGQELSVGDVARFVGAGFEVQAELSGPGLRETVRSRSAGPTTRCLAIRCSSRCPRCRAAGTTSYGTFAWSPRAGRYSTWRRGCRCR
jgi:hypothetical protein